FGYTVDMIMAGNKQSSQIFIFSKNYQAIANKITSTLGRGVTIIDGVGAYTGNPSKMMIVICRKPETEIILKMVRDEDPDAFLSVGTVMGVYGEGFEALPEAASSKKKKQN
ncbi:MAG: YitT family protein, partial [Rikenellaceae bacterium]|nr:YitT family protein [Rikenellaceae bacterium]